MGLSKRDKEICKDLNRFRCMSLDDIADIHFKGLKKPKNSANNVLKRLFRDGYIKRSTAFQPYVYFGSDVNMKEDSAKIGHFLAIVQVYKEMLRIGKIDTFQVEPKYGAKGTVEPDIFCICNRTPFFIEVQKTVYAQKTMDDKLKRYENLYESQIIKKEPWQPKDKTLFPIILILSEQRFALDSNYPFELYQSISFQQFFKSLDDQPKENTQRSSTPPPKKQIQQQELQPKRKIKTSQNQQTPPNLNIKTSSNVRLHG